jgi:hypothetical protein
MAAHPPPLPPAQRPRRGSGPNTERATDVKDLEKASPPGNPDQQGQTAGVAQNTHNKGYQQDR